MTRRTGIPTMLNTAQRLQELITNYQPTIAQVHPTNQALTDAITSCANCLVDLIQELSEVRELGD